MDIFFTDPDAIPLPPNEVRIQGFRVEPWPDGRRVRIHLELTPFQKRPDGEILIVNAQGEELASVSIIETIDPKMEFTLHLRGAELVGPFSALVRVFYPDRSEQKEGSAIDAPREVLQVDQASTIFDLPV